MVDVRVRRPIAPNDVAAVRSLAEIATVADGHPSLGDGIWRDLADPSPDSALVLASEDGELIGAMHLAPNERDHDGRGVTSAIVVHPDHREAGVARALVDAAEEYLHENGGARLVLWAYGADDRADGFARASGFAPDRELWQMRVPLPLAETPSWPPGVEVRTFEPGRDEDAWLEVNNRAFASDPDQGGWTKEMLKRRESEPWFDPSGFLLAFDERGLAGFCWTKVHPPTPPYEPTALGEIYVIGVDSDRRGTGLGRALTAAGLASLHERGVPTGMLYVDAGNEAAVGLYRALGFEVARTDRAYEKVVS